VADNLQSTLKSLQKYHDDHRRLSGTKKEAIDLTVKKLNQTRTEAEAAQKDAREKWVVVITEERNRKRQSADREVFHAMDAHELDAPLQSTGSVVTVAGTGSTGSTAATDSKTKTLQKKTSRIMSISSGFMATFGGAPATSDAADATKTSSRSGSALGTRSSESKPITRTPLSEEPEDDDFPMLTMDVMLTFADTSMTANEFNGLLERMRKEIPTQDVKSLLLLGGSYKDCVSGVDVLKFMQKWYLKTFGAGGGSRLPVNLTGGAGGNTVGLAPSASIGGLEEYEKQATAFCNQLVVQEFLKPVGVGGVTLSGTFGAGPGGAGAFTTGTMYQWKRMTLETEPPHKKALREAEKAESDYKKLVKSAEAVRVALESQCVEVRHSKLTVRLLLATLCLPLYYVSIWKPSNTHKGNALHYQRHQCNYP
jgi:hypothetical protein